MELINGDGEVVEKWTSDGKNHVISGLSAGDYVLKEVAAPDGYVIATDIEFTVYTDGTIKVENVDSTAISADGNPLIVMVDEAEKIPEKTPEIPKIPITPGVPTGDAGRNPLGYVMIAAGLIGFACMFITKKKGKKLVKINKKFIVAAISAALLAGGAAMLTKDDISQKIKEKELIPYMPAPIILAELDEAVPEVPTEEFQAETEYVKPENIQNFSDITPETPVSEAPSENIQNELRETVREMQTAYPDTVGWLYIPDTSVNYPIMQGGDNDFYLHHAYDGSWLSSGSVFLDFRCESRFMNNLNVLYGHHMNNGSMFAGVCHFKDYGYFQAHKYGWMITADDVYRIDFFSAAVTDCNDEIYSGFENTADRLSHIYDISAIYEPTEISEQDRLVLLSTCSYEFENARTVLTGKLVRMGDDI